MIGERHKQSKNNTEGQAAPNVHNVVVSMLKNLNGKMLDLGCGKGALIRKINRICPGKFIITGADLVPKMSKRIPCSNFVNVDINKLPLPFKEESFDVVTLIEVIEHIQSPISLLLETHRILKKGGVAIVSTPNIENFQSRISFLFTCRLFSFLDSDIKGKKMGWRIYLLYLIFR